MVSFDIFGDIDHGILPGFKTALSEAYNADDHLRITLCSDGGEVPPALAIHDAIKAYNDVRVFSFGLCASAAVLIQQGAAVRTCSPNCHFLVHPVTATTDAPDIKEIEAYFNTVVTKLVSARVGAKNYATALKLKTFDAETAVKLNFIDEITG